MSPAFLFVLFVFYSFVGWLSEVVYCSILERRFVNRGFLFGPLCPVYGFGALLVIYLLEPFAGNVPLLFAMAVLVTSALEYATGLFLETAFGTRWWDYSSYRFNLHGRICLLNSLLFGAMGVVGVRFLHPLAVMAASAVPPAALEALALVFAAALAVDLGMTLRSLSGFSSWLSTLSEFLAGAREAVGIGEWLDERDLAGSLAAIRERIRLAVSEDDRRVAERVAARLERIVSRARGLKRLLGAFPGAGSRSHGEELALLRGLHSVVGRISERPALLSAALRVVALALAVGALAFAVAR